MRQFIFGFDTAHPSECARELRARGIDGVVLSSASEEVQAALERESIELSLCFQALAVPKDADETMLARDIDGMPVRWFGSGCPTDQSNFHRNLNAALARMRETPTTKRLIVDGLRFASFASPEGEDAFLTCFCPRCKRMMREYGFDADAIEEAVRALREHRLSDGLADLVEWRQTVVEEMMADFADQVHALPKQIEAGAFVFAPSLAGYVGQTMDCYAALDWVSPMLYRTWPEKDGPACLNHEHAGALRRFGRENIAQAAKAFNVPYQADDRTADEIFEEGFPPEQVGWEVEQAKEWLTELKEVGQLTDNLDALLGESLEKEADGPTLAPILQRRDPDYAETALIALESGADQIGWFSYGS